VATYDIDEVQGNLAEHSGESTLGGTSPVPVDRRFSFTAPDRKTVRPYDAEVKFLEDLAIKLKTTSTGPVYLYSGKTICDAPGSVIDRLRIALPGVRVEVTHGG
jgi:hypothetical protein